MEFAYELMKKSGTVDVEVAFRPGTHIPAVPMPEMPSEAFWLYVSPLSLAVLILAAQIIFWVALRYWSLIGIAAARCVAEVTI